MSYTDIGGSSAIQLKRTILYCIQVCYQPVDFLLFVQPFVFGVIFKKGLVEGEYVYEAKATSR